MGSSGGSGVPGAVVLLSAGGSLAAAASARSRIAYRLQRVSGADGACFRWLQCFLIGRACMDVLLFSLGLAPGCVPVEHSVRLAR
jgi:hypothetical protein